MPAAVQLFELPDTPTVVFQHLPDLASPIEQAGCLGQNREHYPEAVHVHLCNSPHATAAPTPASNNQPHELSPAVVRPAAPKAAARFRVSSTYG